MPLERGAVLYSITNGDLGWRIYYANEMELFGSGSLNRFLDQAVLPRNPQDPTGVSPPGFALVSDFGPDYRPDALKGPCRDDIEKAVCRGDFKVAREERKIMMKEKEKEKKDAALRRARGLSDKKKEEGGWFKGLFGR